MVSMQVSRNFGSFLETSVEGLEELTSNFLLNNQEEINGLMDIPN